MIDSPFLIVHISAGLVGLLSGAAAMAYTKGSKKHRKAGNLFFISMLLMAISGAMLALFKSQLLVAANGILTFYLVATAWATVKRKPGTVGYFEWAALIVAVLVGAALLVFGLEAAHNRTGLKDGFPAGMYFFFAFIAALGAKLDAQMIATGGLYGRQRISRHLWRMSFALLIATVSFFLGQSQVFPKAVQTSGMLFVPVGLIALSMIFWLFNVRFAKRLNKDKNKRNSEAEIHFVELAQPE